ncbi:MAG: hypothetical protein AB8B91_21130 [Rubripirellula sp.]
MIDAAKFEKARKMSLALVWFLPIGILLALSSLLEGSRAWAMLICTTAWIGIAWGLGATTGWTEAVLGIRSEHAPARSAFYGLFMAVFTFWGPHIAGFITIMGIGGALPEAHQPSGGLHQGNMYQSFSMYFCCVGSVWWGVYKATRERTDGT